MICLLYWKCMAQCNCVNGTCSAGCGSSGNAWSTGGAKCIVDEDVNINEKKQTFNF
jgi:hypothetical protein